MGGDDACDARGAEVQVDFDLGHLRGEGVGGVRDALAVGVERGRGRVEAADAFDDVAARFGLDDTTRDTLAARQLLYDRDRSGGSFRHAYSRSFDDRFFLEICERREGYTGFGASNAAVRLAAQRAVR